MNITIKPLTPEMADEFIYYFDHDAFTDHEEWAACYCLESHLTSEENERLVEKDDRRAAARSLVESGVMRGYLVYDGDHIVGWCNAGDKSGYRTAFEAEGLVTEDDANTRIMSLYCIDLAKSYQGKGIAKLLLERVLSDAREQGFDMVEGYPFADTEFAYQYHAPLHLYEKYGFEVFRKLDWFYIVRKRVSA